MSLDAQQSFARKRLKNWNLIVMLIAKLSAQYES